MSASWKPALLHSTVAIVCVIGAALAHQVLASAVATYDILAEAVAGSLPRLLLAAVLLVLRAGLLLVGPPWLIWCAGRLVHEFLLTRGRPQPKSVATSPPLRQ
jgi:hypothetical protein